MSDVTSKHRRQLFTALGWEPQDQYERDWIETGVGHIGRSVKSEVMSYELERLAGAFASFEASVRAELAQLVADAEGAWTFTTGKPEDLPDSDEQVMAISREGDRVLVWLEFTDDSEGHGEPYWRADGGDLALCNYPYWRPLPKSPEQP